VKNKVNHLKLYKLYIAGTQPHQLCCSHVQWLDKASF